MSLLKHGRTGLLVLGYQDTMWHLQLLTFQNCLRKEYESRFSSENFLLDPPIRSAFIVKWVSAAWEKKFWKKKAVSPSVPGRTGDDVVRSSLDWEFWVEEWLRRVALWMWRSFRNTSIKLLSLEIVQLCLTLCNPMDCNPQAPLSLGFSRQEYWSGLPFPSPGDFSYLGMKPGSIALHADSLLSEPHYCAYILFIRYVQ